MQEEDPATGLEAARPDFVTGDDGAGYIDAATVALSLAAVNLGPAPEAARSPAAAAPSSVTPELLRRTMGFLVTGVCVVSTISDGDDVAMTANSVTSVSLSPPLVLVCVARTARFHDALSSSSVWGLSVLDAHAAEISAHLARPGRTRDEQLQQLQHHRGPETGVALLDSSCATLECTTEHVYPGGDHSIVVGRVVSAHPRTDAANPLVFHRGAYRWLQT